MILRQNGADEHETVPVNADPAREFQERHERASRIAAFERERRGYVERGLLDRVRQVDEQLKQLGHVPGEPVETPNEAELQAALKREREARDRETERQAQINALLDERAKCEGRGLVDRVAAVDAELHRLGYEVVPPKKRRGLGVKR